SNVCGSSFAVSFFLRIRRPLIYTLFPYTTLFRSTKPGKPSGVSRRGSAASRSWWRSHDATSRGGHPADAAVSRDQGAPPRHVARSEEHTSELQSRGHLVCRLLLEKKKKKKRYNNN